jgi:hypothetical protein
MTENTTTIGSNQPFEDFLEVVLNNARKTGEDFAEVLEPDSKSCFGLIVPRDPSDQQEA